MQEKTAQSGEFKARSGRVVKPQADGSIRFGVGIGYLGKAEVMDAEEYFQAKYDAELGRWRDPLNPDYVVYLLGDDVRVVREHDGESFTWGRESAASLAPRENAGPAVRVAAAYFEAHPERKPWHDAVHGEVWVVTETNGEALYRVNAWGRFEQVSGDNGLLSFPISHVSITAARRVWPEDAS